MRAYVCYISTHRRSFIVGRERKKASSGRYGRERKKASSGRYGRERKKASSGRYGR